MSWGEGGGLEGHYRSQVDERIQLLAFRPRANGGIGGRLSGIRETIVSTRVSLRVSLSL